MLDPSPAYALAAGGAVAALCFALAAAAAVGRFGFDPGGASGRPTTVLDWVISGLLLLTAPYAAARWRLDRRIRSAERHLCDLVADLADAAAAGIDPAEAWDRVASAGYGALGPELRRVSTLLRWGVPLPEALEQWTRRWPTPAVRRTVAILRGAYRSGGAVPEALRLAAAELRRGETERAERRAIAAHYLAVVYLACGVFLFTATVLLVVFLPRESLAAAVPFVAGELGAGLASSVALAITAGMVAHAVGDGLVAGLVSQGRFRAGLGHTAVLVAVSWVILRLVLPALGGPG